MNAKQAKDLLVGQTVQQAAIEGVPLSDLEKRMMYFTESDDAVEDPSTLNDEFEAKYDGEEYEAKISGLLHHAYKRVKKENPETARTWDESIRFLRKGDHFILVLWGEKQPEERPPYDSLKLLGAAILLIVVGGALMYGFILISDHYGIHGGDGPTAHGPMPLWMRRLLISIMVGGYLYFVVLPLILKKPPTGIGNLLLRVFRRTPNDTLGK
jgi:hypothetical protein